MGAGSAARAIVVSLGLMAATGAVGADLSRDKARLFALGLLPSERPDEPGRAAPSQGPVFVTLPDADRSPAGPVPQPVAEEPPATLGLLQRLALFFVGTPYDEPAPVAIAFAPSEPAPPAPAAIAFVPYSGPIAPGTVVINMTQRQIFRIREGGWAERYQAETQAELLSMIGALR